MSFNPMFWPILLLIVGIVILPLGAAFLVEGASSLARRYGVSELVIGLTVVAFGTSAPEMAVSLSAAITGQADVAVGNVVGSNIFNVLFILGACALILPLIVNSDLLKVDLPLMVGVSALLVIFGADGRISRLEGAALFSVLVGYVLLLLKGGLGRKAELELAAELEVIKPLERAARPADALMRTGLGLVLLVLGAQALVHGAVDIARGLGVSELVIGLTIVAVGTSLPEVAASIVGTLRGKRDIALGNIIGSNTFNILCVLGLSALVSPKPLLITPSLILFDLPVMVLAAVFTLLLCRRGTVGRAPGAALLLVYTLYTLVLIRDAQHGIPASSPLLVVAFTALVGWTAWETRKARA